jgi:tetratricopeptide (TPR) repeat protein
VAGTQEPGRFSVSVSIDPRQRPSLEQMFQQAVALHRQGDLPAAEHAYRRLMAAEPAPTFAPRHLCGLVCAQQQRYDEALALIGQALRVNPNVAEALSNYGNVLRALGRFDEALASYDRALALRPDPTVHNNRAIVLANLLRLEDALAGFSAALALKPDYVQALYNRANLLQERGRDAEAEADYAGVVALKPDFAPAHNNRGAALQRLGRPDEALASFETAIRLDPGFAEAFNNRGNALQDMGRHEDAARAFRRAADLKPGYAEAMKNLGCALVETGRPGEAIAALRQAVDMAPDFADAHLQLAATLAENGHIAEGFAHFMRRAELVFGPGAPPRPPADEPPHKRKHDREQRDFLHGGRAPDDAPQVTDMLRLEDGERLPGPAVNPAHTGTALAHRWESATPRVIVLDDFLTPAALAKLRRYCHGSTVWRRVHHIGNYIGAMPQDGFAAPFLAQIAEETQALLKDIIGDNLFHYLGAFRYDSELSSGTGLHADYSMVNVNFYITPDEANRDPESGGLKVWDAAPPPDWSFPKYNGDMQASRAYLDGIGAKSVTVPYRANRALVFDSALFHETDTFSFLPGYENQRINVSLLFGRR